MKTLTIQRNGKLALEISEQLLREAGMADVAQVELSVLEGRIIIETPAGRQAAFAAAKLYLFERYPETMAKLAK